MQNFTFGRKGTNWFLFAFVLLIGTLPSFGQECPTTDGTESSQSFCYLETVGDIVTDGNAIYQTADNVNDTQPIPEDELLATGTTTYYAGSTSGNCSRIAIEVTVETNPRPILLLTEERSPGFEFTTCASEDFDSEDLATLFEADEDFTIEVYDSEFGQDPYNGVLQPGGSYFVGQVQDGECPSLRTAVGFNPNNIEGPNAASAQTFCEGATVADLEASGTYSNTQALRWYRSQNGTSPLASSTELIDGQTYFVGQVVNNRESITPPCETPSEDRTAVTVEIVEGPDAGEDAVGEVCESAVAETFPSESRVEGFYLDLLEEGVPTNGTFSPSISQIINQYQNDEDGLGDFTVTYTIGEGNCQDSVDLTIRIVPAEDANAGDDVSLTYCVENDEDINLYDFLSDDAIETGEFSAPFEDGIFNPSEAGSGTYSITYSVNEDNSCVNGSDEATFTIEVNEVNEEDITINIDPSELEGMTEEEALNELTSRFAPYFDGFPNVNAFDPELEVAFAGLDPENPEGTYEVSYSGNSCEILNFTVNIQEETDPTDPTDPTPGDVAPGIVCETDVAETFPSVNRVRGYYLNLLPQGVSRSGTFNPTPSEIVDQYQADEDGLGDFTTVYTVNGESYELTVTIIPVTEANAGDDQNLTFCINDGEQDLFNFLSEDAYQFGTFVGYEDGTFNPSVEGADTYQITYRVSEDVDCVTGTAEATFTIQVNEVNEEDITITINSSEFEGMTQEQAFNELVTTMSPYFDGTPDMDAFDPELEVAFAGLDPENPEGTYEVSYSGNSCEILNFTVIIQDEDDPTDPNPGDVAPGVVCETDVPETFSSVNRVRNYYLNLLPSGTPRTGSFNPTITEMVDMYQADEDGLGDFTTIYTVNGESFELTITIIPVTEADAGENQSLTFCVEEGEQNLYDFLSDDAYQFGTFEGYEDGIFNPSEEGTGTYEITYRVSEDNDCVTGNDTAVFTITVNEGGPANAGDDFSTTFCSNDENQDLFAFLSEDALTNGFFEGYEDGIFSPSELGAGQYTFNYIVNEDSACVEGEDSAVFSIEVFEAPNAGENISESLCITEAEEMITNPQAAIEWFNGLIDVDGVDQDGTFDPALETLAAQIFAYVNAPDAPSATFSTTYTVENDNCEDSATITLTINDEAEAEAGEDVAVTFCASQGQIDLRDYLTDTANPNGYFEDFNGIINTNELEEGEYTYTYIVDESVDCVTGEDSAEFTVTIIGDIFVGSDKTASICNANIENGMFPTVQSVRNYYLNLLDEGVSRQGTFSPSIEDLVNWYNNESELGDFTTTYTLTEGECSASVQLTLTIYDEVPAELEPIDDVTLCSIDEDQDLYSFLPTNAIMDGNFIWNDEVIEGGILSPSMLGAGEYEITYSITDDTPCVSGEASESFTVTVLETVTAGMDMDAALCANQGEVNLYNYLDAQASDSGEFTYEGEVLADGIFDASAMGEGTFEVTYTVEPINECGVESSTLTITVNEVPEAPEADATFFACESDMATAAWLEAEGTDLMWYSDADLTMMVSEEDMLESGSYFVTQTLNGCESEAAEVVVTINVVPAPTASTTSFEFCDRDAATLADLTDAISFEGTLIWYDSADGDNSLGTSTRLQNGTYYASQDDGECESLDRLAITVSVENCPIIYPEGISPNGDGINDTFIVENLENEYPNYSIEIFNRWGNTIYKGNASTPAWDGTSNQSGALGDDVLPIGVYFYVIDYGDGSTAPRQGKVYLSR